MSEIPHGLRYRVIVFAQGDVLGDFREQLLVEDDDLLIQVKVRITDFSVDPLQYLARHVGEVGGPDTLQQGIVEQACDWKWPTPVFSAHYDVRADGDLDR